MVKPQGLAFDGFISKWPCGIVLLSGTFSRVKIQDPRLGDDNSVAMFSS
jgi:hypothetical protein